MMIMGARCYTKRVTEEEDDPVEPDGELEDDSAHSQSEKDESAHSQSEEDESDIQPEPNGEEEDDPVDSQPDRIAEDGHEPDSKDECDDHERRRKRANVDESSSPDTVHRPMPESPDQLISDEGEDEPQHEEVPHDCDDDDDSSPLHGRLGDDGDWAMGGVSEDDSDFPVRFDSEDEAERLDEAPSVNRGGRPWLINPDLERPPYELGDDCEPSPHSLRHMLQTILNTCTTAHLSIDVTTKLFDHFRDFFPPGNVMPHYRHARRLVEAASPLKALQYPSCPHDCHVFETDLANCREEVEIPDPNRPPDCMMKRVQFRVEFQQCPVCQHDMMDHLHRPLKVFHFIGLRGRLRMMLEDRRLHDALMLPPVPIEFDPAAVVRNVWQSRGWYDHVALGHGRVVTDPVPEMDKNFSTENGRRNIVLTMCSDGFAPLRDKHGYSMLPFMFMVLNLPENVRHKFAYMIPAACVPGPHKPKNTQPYMDVVLNEVNELYENGITYRCPIAKDEKTARVKLLYTCADYPGHADMNRQQPHSAAFGCIKCEIRSTNVKSRRAFDEYASLLGARAPPTLRTHDSIMAGAAIADAAVPGDKLPAECKGVSGTSSLSKVPTFNMADHSVLDMMHTVSGCFKHIHRMITTDLNVGDDGPAPDVIAAQEAAAVGHAADTRIFELARDKFKSSEELKRRGQMRRHGIAPPSAPKRPRGLPVPLVAFPGSTFAASNARWRMPDKVQFRIESNCLENISAPAGFIVKTPLTKMSQLNSYDKLTFARLLGKYTFAHFFTGKSLGFLCSMMDLIRLLTSSVITTDLLNEVEVLVRRLAMGMPLVPGVAYPIVFHNLIFHMPSVVQKWGPVRATWMFPYERFIGYLARTIGKARNHPERSMMLRWVDLVSAQNQLSTIHSQDDARLAHPLVSLEESNSMSDKYHVHWPIDAMKKKSRTSFPVFEEEKLSTRRSRAVLVRIFGLATVVQQCQSLGYDIRRTTCKVQIGDNVFSCKEREEGRQVYNSRSSWFRIKGKNVPNYAVEDGRGEAMVYGRFHHFIQVESTGWTIDGEAGGESLPMQYYGRCELYAGVRDVATRLDEVTLTHAARLQWRPRLDRETRDIEYVRLADVEGMIVIGPKHKIDVLRVEDAEVQPTSTYFVMPIEQ